jgi:hypothetical protein
MLGKQGPDACLKVLRVSGRQRTLRPREGRKAQRGDEGREATHRGSKDTTLVSIWVRH